MYGPFIINSKTKPKTKLKTNTRVEVKGLTKANEKKVDIIYAKGFVKLAIKNIHKKLVWLRL